MLIVLGGTQNEPIAQSELLYLHGLTVQMESLQRMYDACCGSIAERLRAGAEVEPGAHAAELVVETKSGGKLYRVLLR